MILKEKAAAYNADAEIQALLQEIVPADGSLEALLGAKFSPANAETLKSMVFDAQALASRPLPYEKLDQLVFDLLLGVK